MCIIAVIPQGKTVDDEVLRRCWDRNDDGAGYAYVNGNARVVVRKAFMTFVDFLKCFRESHEKYGESSPFLVHFRIRTHGAPDGARTHPFYIGSGKDKARPALVHNGILSSMPYDKEKSDTQIFVERYPKFFESAEFTESIKEDLGKAIQSSKFAVLFPDKKVVIVNEDLGNRDDNGVWFSHSGWRNYGSRTTGPSYAGQQVCNTYGSFAD